MDRTVHKLVDKSVAEVERAVRSVETELVSRGLAEVEQTLLRFGLVHSKNKKMNELIAACKEGRADVVQELLEKFEPSQRDDKGWSPLHYASQYGHKEIVELLLQRGCLPQIETRDRDKKSDTPLHLASVNGHEDVVRCLLEALLAGEPLRRNKEGNNPLHLASKVGNTSIVHVLREYSPSAAYEANYHSVTPFGFALSNSHLEIANSLLEHAKGNPADRFRDFSMQFPSFDHKRSLDFPVKLLVVGDHRSAKSTLIKSLQVEGIWDRFLGMSMNVPNVDQHKAGLVPSDFSSRSFGRVIFYDLASGPDFIHEDMIQSADDIMHSAFIICINLKEERKEMESRMLYWMNFIYKQCTSYCGPQNKPNVAIVGTFGDVVKPFRLVNAHRLHLSYNSVIASHPEVSAQFNLLRKYCILDCRKSETPSMDALRSALKKLCQRLRPTAKEIPSRCYVLSSVLATEVADTSEIQLWELAAKISSTASKDKKALCNLLPQTAEELLPLCQLLQLQCRVTLLNRSHDHNIQSTWVIHMGHRLITIINNALNAAKESSETSSTPALIKGESLREYFSSISLDFDLLLHLLEHFKIYDSTVRVANSSGEDDQQLFYLPSLLPRKRPLKSWDPNKSSYSFQFAWALVPTAGQECQFFMPRFLKLLLLSLLSVQADYSFIASSNGIFCRQDELEFCLMVKSEAIILSMRCKHDSEVPCLQLRNQILNDIRAHKERLQPATKTSEYVISMEGAKFPLKKLSKSQMSFPISALKSIVMKNVATGSPDPDVQAMLFVEPYFHLSMLSESYRTILCDPENAPKSVSSEFMAAVAKCFGEKWKNIMKHLDLASDTSTRGSHSHSSEESLEKEYGQLLEKFSSISIFETSDLRRALRVWHHRRRGSVDSGLSVASSMSGISGKTNLPVPVLAARRTRSNSGSMPITTSNSLTGIQKEQHYSLPSTSLPEVFIYQDSEDDEHNLVRREEDHILDRNLVMLTQSLNMDLIRPYLRQHKVITEEEHLQLLEISRDARTGSRSTDVEHLVHMIKRKHTQGLRQFISALEKTAEQDQGHQEILDALRWDSQYIPDLEYGTRNPEERVHEVREELHPSFSQSACDLQNGTNKEDQTEVSNSTFVLQQAADEPRSDIPACNYTKPEYEEAQTTDDLGTSIPTLQLSRDPSVPDPSSHQSDAAKNSSHQLLPSTLPDEFNTSIAHEPETHASVSYQVPSHQLQVVKNYTTCSKFVRPVPFVDTMELLVCDNSGGEFNNEAHDITFRIPEGAIPKGLTMTIEIGVALHGPFNFPANLRPISSILWLCPQQDIPLQKPFEVTLPHFLSIHNEKDQKRLGLCFMKANHTDITVEERYNFQVVNDQSIKFSRKGGSNFGHLGTKRFCFLCIGAKKKREVALRAGYCLSRISPEPWPNTLEPFFIHFCVTYFLKTCFQTLEQQIQQLPSGLKIMSQKLFSFSARDDGLEPRIEISFDRYLPQGWIMTLDNNKPITASEIDCWGMESESLQLMEERNIYPPRFTLEVCGSSATGTTFAELKFSGTRERLDTEFTLPYFLPELRRPRYDSEVSQSSISSGYDSVTSPYRSGAFQSSPYSLGHESAASLQRQRNEASQSSLGSMFGGLQASERNPSQWQKRIEDKPIHFQCGPTMLDLLNKVAAKIPTKWRQMGIQLGLATEELDIIETRYQHYDPLRCFEAVFQKWKDTFPEEYSWETIIEALKAPIIQNNHLVEILKKEFH